MPPHISRNVISAIANDTPLASLFVDFESVDGAVYEVQWFDAATLTHLVGSCTVTASQIEIAGLERGKQYWVQRARRPRRPVGPLVRSSHEGIEYQLLPIDQGRSRLPR